MKKACTSCACECAVQGGATKTRRSRKWRTQKLKRRTRQKLQPRRGGPSLRTGRELAHVPDRKRSPVHLSASGPVLGFASRDRDRDFGKVRLWGTFGWIAVGIGMGQWMLHQHTPEGVSAELVTAAQDLSLIHI